MEIFPYPGLRRQPPDWERARGKRAIESIFMILESEQGKAGARERIKQRQRHLKKIHGVNPGKKKFLGGFCLLGGRDT
jgi:hypothetical protein